MKKVLLIGPFEDYGGREIDTAFIASSLYKNFEVSICSTGNMTKKSQIFLSLPVIKVNSLKESIYRNYFILRPAAVLSYFKNKKKEPVYFYVNNKFNSGIFFKKLEFTQLKRFIKESDVIFIRAHIYTARIKEIIELASEYNKKIIFRTTGAIDFKSSWPEYLNKVHLFVHHSKKNAEILHSSLPAKYDVIDQSAIQEGKLLELKVRQQLVSNFAVIGRLSEEKNILNLIAYFKKCSSFRDKLYIIGDGELKYRIDKEIGGSTNILILGQLSSEETADFLDCVDCIIISSFSEAGPLVGVEAMAAAKIILSTEVGAMPNRLSGTGNDFWFHPESYESFEKQYKKIKSLKPIAIRNISTANRNRYLQFHSRQEVAVKYIRAVQTVLNSET